MTAGPVSLLSPDARQLLTVMVEGWVDAHPPPGLTREEAIASCWNLLDAGLARFQATPEKKGISYRLVPIVKGRA